MILKDLKTQKGEIVDDPDPAGPTRRTINGLFQPVITTAPGQLEFWRIGNMSANIFYDLELKGVAFQQTALDGNLQNQITPLRRLTIPPGGRAEVLVRAPAKRGNYQLRTRSFNTGPAGDSYPAQKMATLRVTGDPVESPPLPEVFPPVPDLREEHVDHRRTVVFDDTDDPNVFVIDGRVWDRDRVDQNVRLGDLEEWTVQNASQEFHVFHIHQGDFQVTEINGVEQPFRGYQDVVNLPIAQKNGDPGEVKFLLRFDPPIIAGEYVYHCHIVQHEDQGMMANIVVEDALARALRSEQPSDPIADALMPATDNFWCKP
jgi:suppressor of ftsI